MGGCIDGAFNTGYVLVATYPVRSDESERRKQPRSVRKKLNAISSTSAATRIATPEPVAGPVSRQWVQGEAHPVELLEHTHGKTLPESDLRVILRGKSLSFTPPLRPGIQW